MRDHSQSTVPHCMTYGRRALRIVLGEHACDLPTKRANTERQRIYHAAHVSANKARNKGCNTILDRFLNCPICRASQIQIGSDEEHCARSDASAAADHSHITTAEERKRREKSWVLVLDSSGKNGPMNQREDYAEAIKIKERLYEEKREGNTRLHPSEQVRQRTSQPFSWYSEGTQRVDPKTG